MSSVREHGEDEQRPARGDDDGAVARSTIRVRETIDLAAIFEPHLNAVVLERAPLPTLQRYAARLARGPALTITSTAAFDPEEGTDGLDDLARLLPADDARDVLAADVAYWVEVMAELTGATSVGVRLARLTSPMCPVFHVDRVTLRLVCTYSGPASEWLDASDIVPGGLATPRLSPAAIRWDAPIESCSPFDVLLLKGSAWPGDSLRGAVHRSPSTSVPRLLLTLDPLD